MDETVILCPRPTVPVDGLNHSRRGTGKKTRRRGEDVQVCTLIDLYQHFSLAEAPTAQQPGEAAPIHAPVGTVPPATPSPPTVENTMTTPNKASTTSPNKASTTSANKARTTSPNTASTMTPNKAAEDTPQQSHKRTWVATCKPDGPPTHADTHHTPTQPARKIHGVASQGDVKTNVPRGSRSCERQKSLPQASKSASMDRGNRYAMDELRERARVFRLELGQRLRDPDGAFLRLGDLRAAVRELELEAPSSAPSRTLASDGGYAASGSHSDEEGYGDELSYLVKRVRVEDPTQQPQSFMPYIS